MQYISFVEDTGAEHVASLFRWVYFRKENDGNGFDLFSDLESRIMHMNRMLLLLGIITGVNFLNGTNMLRLWYTSDFYSLNTPVLILTMCLITGYGYYRISRQKQRLVKEQALRE